MTPTRPSSDRPLARTVLAGMLSGAARALFGWLLDH